MLPCFGPFLFVGGGPLQRLFVKHVTMELEYHHCKADALHGC